MMIAQFFNLVKKKKKNLCTFKMGKFYGTEIVPQ